MDNNEEQSNQGLPKDVAEKRQEFGPLEAKQDVLQAKVNALGSIGECEENNGSHGFQARAWKHQSFHQLTNVLMPVDFGMMRRSKFRNMIAITAYISMVEPKNIIECT